MLGVHHLISSLISPVTISRVMTEGATVEVSLTL